MDIPEQSLHHKFMRIAIALAQKNVDQTLGGPFGAVVVKNGNIVAKSANKVALTNDPTAHAEVSAIRMASKKLNTFDLSDCTIYTSCEPCPMCLGAIYWSRIAEVYYGNTKDDAAEIGFDDKFIYEELELPSEKRKLSIIRLLPDEAIHSFKKWKFTEVKVEY